MSLLELCFGASFYQLLNSCFSFVFRHSFFQSSRSAVNGSFGFFQTQASDFTNGFDGVNFLLTSVSQNEVEFSFFFSSFATGRRASNYCSCSRNTEFFFHGSNQFSYFHDSHFSNSVDDIVFAKSHLKNS
ncbi:ATPase of the AAA+class [Zymobacter palmae]|uniref:ATPase of the AAA+class n=1 Tax=Zymobacter palmae TaxID=33074 RepID=A0A348HBT6_9GAMM|nr:ATPase of the AAA+class [Zymobacter palmae]